MSTCAGEKETKKADFFFLNFFFTSTSEPQRKILFLPEGGE